MDPSSEMTALSDNPPPCRQQTDIANTSTSMVLDFNHNADVDKKNMNKKHGCENEHERLGLFEGDFLNSDKLFALFHGNQENVDYFIGLSDAVKKCEYNDEGCVNKNNNNTNCDPRDERKRRHIQGWSPTVRVCSLDFIDDEEGGGGGGGVAVAGGSFAVKQTVLDEEREHCNDEDTNGMAGGSTVSGDVKRFPCGVHGCGQVLSSLASYESHYHHCHSYVCAQCRRVFVSDFLLDIHLQENHDSYFAILSPRMDMYRCLVESCVHKFRTSAVRKDHLVTVHKFPASFSFHQPLKGSRSGSDTNKDDKRSKDSSKSVHKASKSKALPNMDTTPTSQPLPLLSPLPQPLPTAPWSLSPEMEAENNMTSTTADTNKDVAMDTESNTSAKSTPEKGGNKNTGQRGRRKQGNTPDEQKRVPASICFGRGSQRAFQPRRGGGGKGRNWYQQTAVSMETTDTTVDIETVDMRELADALT